LIFITWAAGGIHFVPEFTEHVVLREFAGRFGEEMHRPQPFYYYLPHLLHRFAPWSLLLIGLGIVAWRRNRAGSTESRPAISAETFWLLAWSLGGLLVMSCIPSKRIDRIFPIVPPLCVLLAVMVADCRKKEALRVAVHRWSAVAVVLGCLLTSGYVASRIVVAKRENRDAFAVFGRAVVEKVAQNGWRLKVFGGDDEGMLLYVRCSEFIEEPEEAATEWNAAKLDALVVPEDEMEGLLPRFKGGEPQRLLRSEPAGRYRRRYLLLVRPASTS
jgi:4-amino-4-deoxy-L-arabinose transferase-like glycosyltransferase